MEGAYHTKETLPDDISLPDKNGVLYTVTRDEPTSSYMSLGVKVALDRGQAAEGVVVKDESKLFATQMKAVQCDKTACLNCFNTSFMPSLSYKMITTQFTEHQWNKIISPAIQYTLNAASIGCNLVHSVLCGPADYQGLAVKNLYFLQEIIQIIAFLNEAVCNSSTGQLLRADAESFRVEIGIPFSLTSTPYKKNTFAYYLPSC